MKTGEMEQTSTVTIRARRPADLRPCVRILREVHAADGYPMNWPADPSGWLDPPGLLGALVLERDSALGGHLGLTRARPAMFAGIPDSPDGPLAELTRLFVAPTARGCGAGRRLLIAAELTASQAGHGLVLEVVEQAAAAIRLYERQGWRLLGRRPADWTTASGQRPMLRIYAAAGTPDGQPNS